MFVYNNIIKCNFSVTVWSCMCVAAAWCVYRRRACGVERVAEAERARRRRPGESGGPAPSALRASRAPASPLSPQPHAGLATCAPCTPPLSPYSREPCATFLASPDRSVSRSLASIRSLLN